MKDIKLFFYKIYLKTNRPLKGRWWISETFCCYWYLLSNVVLRWLGKPYKMVDHLRRNENGNPRTRNSLPKDQKRTLVLDTSSCLDRGLLSIRSYLQQIGSFLFMYLLTCLLTYHSLKTRDLLHKFFTLSNLKRLE